MLGASPYPLSVARLAFNLTKVRKVRKIELSQRAVKEKESKMNTFILQEQLKEKLISYLSTLDGIDLDDDKSNVLKDIRQIVFDTFQEREV
jgi:DNA-binding protein Fis